MSALELDTFMVRKISHADDTFVREANFAVAVGRMRYQVNICVLDVWWRWWWSMWCSETNGHIIKTTINN